MLQSSKNETTPFIRQLQLAPDPACILATDRQLKDVVNSVLLKIKKHLSLALTQHLILDNIMLLQQLTTTQCLKIEEEVVIHQCLGQQCFIYVEMIHPSCILVDLWYHLIRTLHQFFLLAVTGRKHYVMVSMSSSQ